MASLKGNDLLLHFSTFCLRCVQITQTEVQQGQQQFNQFTDGQVRVPPNIFLKTTKSNPSKKTSEDGEDLYTGRLFVALQQLYQIQQVTMPAGQELTQPMFIQSTNQTAEAQVTQVSTD